MNSTINTLRILVLEDEFVIAQDIYEILEEEGFKNTKIANTYKQAKIITSTWEPQLVLCDINLCTPKSGNDFVTQLKKTNPFVEVIFVTAFNDSETISSVKKVAPLNYILKPFTKKQLTIAVLLALNLINLKPRKTSASLSKLSPTEIKITHQIANGYSSVEIGETLNISSKTVRNHRYNISKKLRLSNENNSLLKWAISNLS
ncbi:DNA-binding response regulator [Lutibacter sp.]